MDIKITQEKRREVERIQQAFTADLSPTVIQRSTAQAINGVLSRSIPQINRRIKAEYNITQKYLSRMASVNPKANSGTLWGGIRLNTGTIPLIAFRAKQVDSSIAVSIHRGKTVYIQNSFIATMLSGHTGVYSRGRYKKRTGFVPGVEKTESGKVRITEIKTASVFTMSQNQEIAQQIGDYMGEEITTRVHGILTSKIKKIQA